jgi:hypothetical protein
LQVLAGGIASIPVLISQLIEESRTRKPVEDFWNYTSSGDVAFIVLNDLFTDTDGKTMTIPGVPDWEAVMTGCSENAEKCWRLYVHRYGMSSIQRAWQIAWNSNQSRIFWDPTARCFRLASR